MIYNKISFVFGVLFPFMLYAQSIITAEFTSGRIEIDGKLTESSWIAAEKIPNLTQVEPDPGQPAVSKTEVQVIYNSEFLYFGGTCYFKTRGQKIRVPDLKRDFPVNESDAFGIILDLMNDKRNATAFFINPLAVQRDEMVTNETVSDANWNTKWFSETQINDSCWTFEIAIPWSSIRYIAGTASVGINFIRLDRATNELSTWVQYPRTFSMFSLRYTGALTGIKPPSPDNEIRFTPYLLMQNNLDRRNIINELGGGLNNRLKPGGDLKWAVSSSTVLDLTLNTDFAQVNADRDIVNLSSFDISLPEQRQFFLENAGLFRAGDIDGNIDPFFSRRIGLDESGRPVPMDGGFRLIHNDPENSYGVLSAITHVPDSAKSFFLVGRYLKNYGEQNKIGLLAVGRRDDLPDGNNDNIVSAADGLIRFSDNLALNWMASGSVISKKSSKRYYGYSQAAYINYLTETMHLYFKNYVISKDYKAETGFTSTNNIAAFEAGTDLYLRPDWKPASLRSYEPGFYFNNNRDLDDGSLRQFYITVWPIYFLFQNGMVISAKWIPTWESLKENFRPVDNINIVTGKYFYSRFEFKFTSDPSTALSYSTEYSTGSFFDGILNKLTSGVKYSPIPNISVSLNNESDWLKYIGELNSNHTINIVSTELYLALNPKVGLTSFYQYNTEGKSSFSSIRFSWEYSPLSYLYVVYNSSNLRDPLSLSQDRSRLLIKVSHQFQL